MESFDWAEYRKGVERKARVDRWKAAAFWLALIGVILAVIIGPQWSRVTVLVAVVAGLVAPFVVIPYICWKNKEWKNFYGSLFVIGSGVVVFIAKLLLTQ